MVRVVYIAGEGRSGSTLLARALGRLPGGVAVGEVLGFLRQGFLALPPNVRCGCGAYFADCLFWRGVRQKIVARLPDVDGILERLRANPVDRVRDLPALYSPWKGRDLERRCKEYRDLLLSLYESVLETSGANYVVDESKHFALLHVLQLQRDVDLRVVHLVRDSRGVAYSWTKRRQLPEYDDEKQYLRQSTPLRSSLRWVYRNMGTELSRRLMARYVRVKYEEFVGDPVGTLRRIASEIGLEAGELQFASPEVLDLSGDHIATGNPSRFEHGSISLRLDSAWKRDLAPWRRRLVTAVTWPWLRRYGYTL